MFSSVNTDPPKPPNRWSKPTYEPSKPHMRPRPLARPSMAGYTRQLMGHPRPSQSEAAKMPFKTSSTSFIPNYKSLCDISHTKGRVLFSITSGFSLNFYEVCFNNF
jgi:hypothetical protein